MENVRKTLKKYYFREIVVYFLVYTMFFSPAVALASSTPDPTDLPSYSNTADYAVGAGSIGSIVPGTNSLTINSVANGTAIYIKNHDIGSLGTVTYNQVSGGWALVKINETLGSTFYGDGAATGIAGTLIATENFIMVNNQGILSAPGSLIQARNLVGSAMRITDTDFGNFANGVIDNLNFFTLPGDVGSVINSGEIDVLESVYLVAKNVVNAGTIVNSGGLVVMAAGDSAIIGRPGSDVVVEVAMTDPANHVVDNSGSLGSGKVILAAGDIFSTAISGIESLRAEAHKDITLNGDVTTTGDITLDAEEDVYANGLATTGGGNINIHSSDSTTHLYGDVTTDVVDGGSIYLHNRSEVDGDVTIQAGDDVFILALLTALGNLTIEATGGGIDATDIFMMVADSLLSLTQYNSLHMEDALQHVINSDDTDLYAKSTGGSVTSSKADTWQSIEADAKTFVNLNDSDTGGDIHISGATTDLGDILITSDLGKVHIDGYIGAGQDVKITAKNESSDSILLYDISNMDAGRDILLNNNTYAYRGFLFSAGRDFKLGYDETHDVYNPKTLTGGGALTVEAGRHITLGGAVVASDDDYGFDLILDADFDFDGVGNVHAMGTLTNVEGNIDISGRTVDLDGAVSADGDLTVVADEPPADQGNVNGNVTALSTLFAYDNISITADDHIDLQDAVEAYYGDITLVADADLGGVGDVDAEELIAGGTVEITASDTTINLHDDVTAGGDITLHNDTVADAGITLDAGYDVHLDDTKTLDGLGNLTVEADHDVYLGGAVTTAGKMHIGADRNLIDDGDVIAKGTLIANGDVAGTSMVVTGNYITLEQDATAAGDMILTADRNLGGYGKLFVQGKLTATDGGDIEMDAGYDTTFGGIFLQYNGVEPEVEAAGDIILHEDTVADDGVVLAAGDDIHVGGDDTVSGEDGPIDDDDPDISSYLAKTLTGDGDLTLLSGQSGNGYGNILLGGEVTTVGELAMIAGVDGGWDESNVKVNGLVTTGLLWVQAGDDIEFYSNVLSSDHIVLSALDDVQTFNGSSITMTKPGTSIFINAGDNGTVIGSGERNVEITGNVDSAGGITIHSDDNVDIDGYVESGTGYINITADDGDGDLIGSIDIDGYVDSGAQLYLRAGDDITLDSWVRSAGNMEIQANWNADGDGDVKVYGTIESTGGDIDIYSADDTTFLYGDYVDAGGSVYLHNDTEAAGDIIAGQNVTIDGTLTLFGDDDGLWGYSDQYITATNGSLYANDWVHKLSPSLGTGNLDMFGGSTLGTTSPYSVYTREVRVEDGELNIHGNGYVRLAGNIYSSEDMRLAANEDGSGGGYLWHSLGGTTIVSDNGDVDLSAQNDTIYLYGGSNLIDAYVSAGHDLLLRDDTVVYYSRRLDAGDDVVLAAGEQLQGSGSLTVKAIDDIMFGVSIATHEVADPPAGSSTDPSGDVTVNGDLILDAGDDIYAYGQLSTEPGSGGAITATAVDNIMLYNTPDSALADGILSLTANTGVGGGVLYAAGNLIGNMYLSGYDVTVLGNVISSGTLDVDADDDIRLKSNVHSDGVMTMDAGSDIDLNEDSGNTSSDSTITLTAGDDVTIGRLLGDEGNVTANGSMNITAGGDSDDDVKVFGKLTTTNGGNIDVQAGDDVTILGTWSDDISPVYESVEADGTLTLTADTSGSGDDGGNLRVAGSVQGNMYLAGTNVTVGGDVTSFGTLNVVADRNIRLKENVSSEDAMTMNAGRDIRLNQDGGETVSDSTVTLIAGRDVKVEGNLTTTGDNDVGNTLVEADRNINFGGNVNVDGHLEAYSGLANYSGAGSIEADGDVIADTMLLEAGAGLPDYSDSHVSVDGLLQTTGGDMVVKAHHDILLGGNVDSAGNLTLNADRHGDYGYPDPHVFGGDVEVQGTVDAVSNIDMLGNNITLWDDVEAGGNIILTADTSSDFADPLPEGDVVALGDLTSTGGSIEIYSDDDTTYLGGDTTAAVDVLLNNNTRFIGYGDQRVTAQTGMITANGWLDKRPFSICFYGPTDGSLYLHAEGDISLANYVTAADDCLSGGGVSIISNNGRIFTPGYGDRLNVDITGRSDHYADVGVDLPFGGEDSGKAAIIIMSGEDLQLGPDGELSAYGKYYDDVDDRVGVGFLAAPATIGDVPRDEGALFDAAIYVASKGDVDVSSPVSILSLPEGDLINGRPECVPKGAMIVDARDTVTFDAALGGQFLASLAAGDVGDRLEVCSRITEWLFQAVDAARLPFAATASAMSTLWYGNPDSYILRGAGLDNPAITDGRAWVLENPAPSAPLYREAGEPAEGQEFAEGGCPALMEWLADELGIEEEIQVFAANTFAYSTDIQPCEICARLRDAATILEDPEGAGVAALAQVVNEFVAPDVPPSTEQMTLIAAAFAEHVGDGTYYAAAGQWIDAVAAYVGILNAEMGYSVDDSAAFAGKYVAPVTETGNASLITYVEARLAALGG